MRVFLFLALSVVLLSGWFWVDPVGLWEGSLRVVGVGLIALGQLKNISGAFRVARLCLRGSLVAALTLWVIELVRIDGGHPIGDHTFSVMLGIGSIICLTQLGKRGRENRQMSPGSSA